MSSSTFRVDVAVRIRPIEGDDDIKSDSQSITYSINEEGKHSSLTIDSSSPSESASSTRQPIRKSIKQTKDSSTNQSTNQSTNKSYRGFRSVFDQSSCNINVYSAVLKPLVDRVLAGETACCFAYGHTGSGTIT